MHSNFDLHRIQGRCNKDHQKNVKDNVGNNDLACSLEDDQLPYLKNIQKEGCKCVLLEGEGHAPFKVGLKWK